MLPLLPISEGPGIDPYDMPEDEEPAFSFPVLQELKDAWDIVEALYEKMIDDLIPDKGYIAEGPKGDAAVLVMEAANKLYEALKLLKA